VEIYVIETTGKLLLRGTMGYIDDQGNYTGDRTLGGHKTETFTCPICGYNTYINLHKYNGVLGPGGYSTTVGYACEGCSVRFDEPDKFSKKPSKPDDK